MSVTTPAAHLPAFGYHELAEVRTQRRHLAHAVAERAVAVGYMPDGPAAAVARAGTARALERGAIPDPAVLVDPTRRVAEAAGRMDRLGELDNVSQDVLTEVLRAFEQQLGMLRVQLPVAE